jgi:hypothetical protein
MSLSQFETSALPVLPARVAVRQCQKPGNRLDRAHAAARGPFDEFGDVNPPIGRFAIVNPALRLLHPRPELTLRQLGLLPQQTQESGQWPIRRGMLSLGGH